MESSNDNKNTWDQLRHFLSDKFNLDDDKADQAEVIENIRRGVEFRGTNLWILMFAIVIASVGLNVNSTAVIIGAMLVSPLMGPIMGIGLSLGINDFELLKRSFKNFLFSVGVSLAVSTIYFSISPALTTQSELLARTTPTIWDVLIASFGGLAGIVAQSRRDRTSTVIPGVAIATALMPPLCTAGFGLATGNWAYFGGAFYLFFINAVFIAFATFFIVRFLKYERKHFLDPKRAKRVRHYMVIIITATLVPSVILAYSIVQRAVFENNAKIFIERVLTFEKSEVMSSIVTYSRQGNTIEVMLIGDPISSEIIHLAENQLTNYKLNNTKLIVRQASMGEKMDNSQMQNILLTNNQIINDKNLIITQLESQIALLSRDTIPSQDIARELGALWSELDRVTISKAPSTSVDGKKGPMMVVCVISTKDGINLAKVDREKLEKWLEQRTKSQNVKLIVE